MARTPRFIKAVGSRKLFYFLEEETGALFGVLDCHDELKHHNLPLQPIMQKWWDCMKDLMMTNADNSPMSIPLKEIFYLQ